MDRPEIVQSYRDYYSPSFALLFDVANCPVEAWGEGMYIYDTAHKQYLDFAAGYGVFGVGHHNRYIEAAVSRQLDTLCLVPGGCYVQPAAELMSKLAILLPDRLDHFLFAGGGSEAVEITLLTSFAARPDRKKLVAAKNSYHGKTLGALSIMGQDHLRAPFEPLMGNVDLVPYGDIDAMAKAVNEETIAVYLEPVLGGGFITVPPKGYLQSVRELCDRAGALLVVDEVQTGFGRTGKMFGIDHEAIVPDMLILSKGITGGYTPISIVAVKGDVFRRRTDAYQTDLSVSGSASGLCALSCAAASAALEFIVEENLPQRAAQNGMHLIQQLKQVAEEYPQLVLDIPGIGLMTGTKLRNAILENAVWLQLLKRGVLSGMSTNSHVRSPVLRFFPPLIVQPTHIDTTVEALRESLKEISRMPSRLYDLANEALKVQYYLPPFLLRKAAHLLAHTPNLSLRR